MTTAAGEIKRFPRVKHAPIVEANHVSRLQASLYLSTFTHSQLHSTHPLVWQSDMDTVEIVEFKGFFFFFFEVCEVFQGYLKEKFKAILATKKNKNYCTTAPPSGLVRSSRDYDRMMRYLRDIYTTFTLAIFKRFDTIFMNFGTGR